MEMIQTCFTPRMILLFILVLAGYLSPAQRYSPASFQQFLQDHLHYPDTALTNQVTSLLYYKAQFLDDSTFSHLKRIDKLPSGADQILLVEIVADGERFVPNSTTFDAVFHESILQTAERYEGYQKETKGPSEAVYFIVNFYIRPRQQDDWDKTFTRMEIDPAYLGGGIAWARYLETQVQYPAKAAKRGIEGEVTVQFIVDKEGNVSEVKALTGPDDLLREEAVRLIVQSGKWRPGIQNGHFIKGYKRLSILFKRPKQ